VELCGGTFGRVAIAPEQESGNLSAGVLLDVGSVLMQSCRRHGDVPKHTLGRERKSGVRSVARHRGGEHKGVGGALGVEDCGDEALKAPARPRRRLAVAREIKCKRACTDGGDGPERVSALPNVSSETGAVEEEHEG